MNENNNDMSLIYIQKQEQVVVEFVRKQVEYEIKVHVLNDNIKTLNEKIEQLNNTINIQNNIIQQSSSSIETLTLDRNRLQSREDNYISKIEKLEKDVFDLSNELSLIKDKYQKELSVSNNYKIELDRQNEELTKLYNSENSSKKKNKKGEDNQF
jgi:chromosome segregation ATPase